MIYNGISSAKIWHIFKHHGHPDVWILDGGLKEWARLELPLESSKQAIDYSGTLDEGRYESSVLLEDTIVHIDEVIAKINTDTQILDTRGPEQYKSGAHNDRGHIPGTKNLHFATLMDEYGNLKSKDELTKIVENLELDPNKETITYCQGGVTACIGIAALKEIGFKNVKLYDGSWAEYSSLEKTKSIQI